MRYTWTSIHCSLTRIGYITRLDWLENPDELELFLDQPSSKLSLSSSSMFRLLLCFLICQLEASLQELMPDSRCFEVEDQGALLLRASTRYPWAWREPEEEELSCGRLFLFNWKGPVLRSLPGSPWFLSSWRALWLRDKISSLPLPPVVSLNNLLAGIFGSFVVDGRHWSELRLVYCCTPSECLRCNFACPATLSSDEERAALSFIVRSFSTLFSKCLTLPGIAAARLSSESIWSMANWPWTCFVSKAGSITPKSGVTRRKYFF